VLESFQELRKLKPIEEPYKSIRVINL
jgi:hypothetical protein